MLKMIDGYLKYANTTDADTARTAFAATLTTELAKNTVIPVLSNTAETSFITHDMNAKTIKFRVFYESYNAGVNDWNSFWMASQSEKNTANALAKSYVRKCDSLHDMGGKNINWVIERK